MFKFNTITPDDVSKVIKKFKPKTSTDYKNINVSFMKQIVDEISVPLSIIINQSLKMGIFPEPLKIAKVIPIFKKDDIHICDNYRPISILPVFSKVFEKIVFNQLYNYFQSNKLFYIGQHGFRREHSTETATLEFVDDIIQALDKNQHPFSIFLDLSKAFDTLDHNILLSKLEYYGITNTPLMWFSSYLTKRYQYVDINGISSNLLQIRTGVPQGSILGPLLFIIYMNDIASVSSTFHTVLYADDTNLTGTINAFNSPAVMINEELNKIHSWMCVNKLSLNVKKTKLMVFSYKNNRTSLNFPDIKLNNNKIERVSEFKFLGIYIDDKLSWNNHVNYIGKKLSKVIGILKRMKSVLPQAILVQLYNSLFLSQIMYSISVWGFKSRKLFKLQKRAVRIIHNAKYNAHTDPLFKNIDALKIKDVFHLSLLKLFFKYKNDNLPGYFANIFNTMNNNHAYQTRRQGEHFQKPNKISSKSCIRYYLPDLLQTTDHNILDKVHTHSIKGFSWYIKRMYIKSYPITCSIANCYICTPR
jgi:hypothetical protein